MGDMTDEPDHAVCTNASAGSFLLSSDPLQALLLPRSSITVPALATAWPRLAGPPRAATTYAANNT